MLSRRSLAAFAFYLLAGAPLVFAQGAGPLSEAELAGLVRTVNTAEMTWKSQNGTYADLQELAKNKLFADRKISLSSKDPDTATIQDYQMRIVVASDRQKYMMELTRANGCGPAMFSSETAIIYRAKALGCE